MTIDYTKKFKKKDGAVKAAEPIVVSVSRKEHKKHAEYICKKCYEINEPIINQQGSWKGFIIYCIIALPILIALSFLWSWITAIILLVIIVFALAYDAPYDVPCDEPANTEAKVVSIAFAPWAYILPNMPYELKGCRACKATDSMVKTNSREGKEALYWHTKKNGGQNNPSGGQF